MDSRMLQYFVKVADCGSLTKAAGELYITQPALSQSMKKLETEVGISLFNRHGNEISLTSAGIIFLNGAREILYVENQAKNNIRIMKEK